MEYEKYENCVYLSEYLYQLFEESFNDPQDFVGRHIYFVEISRTFHNLAYDMGIKPSEAIRIIPQKDREEAMFVIEKTLQDGSFTTVMTIRGAIGPSDS
jgi:hypothetical protein